MSDVRSTRVVLACTAALVVTGLAACGGYQWVRKSTALGSVSRVAVPMLQNHSFEPGIEVLMTEALRREFQRNGGASVVADPGQADLVLTGTVVDLRTSPRSFSSVAFALEYQVEMQVTLSARLADGEAVALPSAALYEWELYLTSADVEAERKNREEALRRLSGVIAARVHDALAYRLTAP